MGVMQGRVEGDTFYIMDSFALPVEATEVRVNAGAEAYEYMAQFLSLGEAVRCPFKHASSAFLSVCWCVESTTADLKNRVIFTLIF